MNPLIQFERIGLLVVAMLVGFALLPEGHAVTPAPDGGYPGFNTAEGTNALLSRTTGTLDTALGVNALKFDNTGGSNTAVGTNALLRNTTGFQNTAVGEGALQNNTININNTATGFLALNRNGSESFLFAHDNTADGFQALANNTTGFDNTAIGADALLANTMGIQQTAVGAGALDSNTIGTENTAVGDDALALNTKGNFNTAVGTGALETNSTGSHNVALGFDAGVNITTGSSNIDIYNSGVSGDTNTIRIGNQGLQTKTFIAGISGTVVSGSAVVVNSSGQLGVAVSSARYKDEIKPMEKASEAILALKPVTFRYKKDIDPDRTPQYGLVAEEVEKVDPALITRDGDGKPYTVRYDAVNAMLLNEFLKAHRQIEEQQKEIEALRTLIQKVSDKVEMSRPAPQTVANNQ